MFNNYLNVLCVIHCLTYNFMLQITLGIKKNHQSGLPSYRVHTPIFVVMHPSGFEPLYTVL